MPSIRSSLLFLGAMLSLTSIATPVPQIGSLSKGSNSSPGGPPGGPPDGSNSSPGGPPDRSSPSPAGPTATSTSTPGDGCVVYTRTFTSVITTSTPTTTSAIANPTPSTVEKLPSTGTSTDLPATNNTIKFVAIGRGIQNYTCTAVNATPVSIGAIAVLFDYTSLAASNETELNTLPGLAVNVPFDPFPLDGTRPSLAGLPPATVLGHHYFAADTTPTFNLTGAPVAGGGNMILFGAKTATVAAPPSSPLGPDGTGAVAWLQLEAKTNIAAETSVGVVEAYRVETAGGNPEATCSSVGTQTIDYAAEYWFFD